MNSRARLLAVAAGLLVALFAFDGPAKGACLQRLDIVKDYWFDWRHYNPAATVFKTAQ